MPALDQPSLSKPSLTRWVVMAGLCLAATIAYMGRNCLGVASDEVRADLGLSELEMGWVMSAFFWSYALAQIPAGWLGQRLGSRLVLPLYATLWSLLCATFYWVGGLWSLIAVQMAFGIAQAGIFPCSAGVVRHWIPATSWALAGGLLGSFMSVGGAIGSAITGYAVDGFSSEWLTIPSISWRWVFVAFAIPGFAWAAWFFAWFRDRPDQHVRVNSGELAVIGRSVEQKPRGPRTDSWLAIAGGFDMMMLYGQQFCRAAGYIFFPTWFPKYLRATRGVTTAESGLLAAMPMLAVVVGGVVGGLLVDALWRRTGSKRISRQVTAVTAMLACAGFIGAAYFVENAVGAVALISLGSFCATLAGPPTNATTIDKAGDHTEPIFGVMNMTGNLGAAACPLVVAWLVAETGNWDSVLLLFVGIYVAGALCWACLDPRGTVATDRPVV